jgi:hypothetical protein
MVDRSVIFSAPMVRALIEGRKTMTRRLAWRELKDDAGRFIGQVPSPWQKVQPGDRLWVRESIGRKPASFLGIQATNGVEAAFYVADGNDLVNEHEFGLCPWWKQKQSLPSIHMPRWASRLTLTVTATKIERLQAITHDDALAEGVGIFPHSMSAQKRFAELWASLHGPQSWDANPEVVAIRFAVEQRNIDK